VSQSHTYIQQSGIKILIRKSTFPKTFVPRFQSTKLPSRMARTFLTTVLTPINLVVATVHLESLASRVTREHQLKIIASNLKSFEDKGFSTLLCGDFNFCSRRNYSLSYKDENDGTKEKDLENRVLDITLPHYDDAWVLLMSNKESYGFTFDSKRNSNILSSKGKEVYSQMRIDRIMLNLSVSLNPSKYQLVGTELISNRFCPSDHFGLSLCIDQDTRLALKLSTKSLRCVSSQVRVSNLCKHFVQKILTSPLDDSSFETMIKRIKTSQGINIALVVSKHKHRIDNLFVVFDDGDDDNEVSIVIMFDTIYVRKDKIGMIDMDCIAKLMSRLGDDVDSVVDFSDSFRKGNISNIRACDHPKYKKYFEMLRRLPFQAVSKSMRLAGLDESILKKPNDSVVVDDEENEDKDEPKKKSLDAVLLRTTKNKTNGVVLKTKVKLKINGILKTFRETIYSDGRVERVEVEKSS